MENGIGVKRVLSIEYIQKAALSIHEADLCVRRITDWEHRMIRSNKICKEARICGVQVLSNQPKSAVLSKRPDSFLRLRQIVLLFMFVYKQKHAKHTKVSPIVSIVNTRKMTRKSLTSYERTKSNTLVRSCFFDGFVSLSLHEIMMNNNI